jgi:hypothetical protein
MRAIKTVTCRVTVTVFAFLVGNPKGFDEHQAWAAEYGLFRMVSSSSVLSIRSTDLAQRGFLFSKETEQP